MSKPTKVLRIVGLGNEGRLVVESQPMDFLSNLGLGVYLKNEGKYLLDPAEVAYITYKNLAIVKDVSGKELSLKDIFTKYSVSEVDWIKFTVLLDLRERGRRARAGYHRNSLIYTKGGSKVMVYVTEENAPLRASLLIEWVASALAKGYEPVLAVVDAHGDVTYYSIFPVRVEELRGG